MANQSNYAKLWIHSRQRRKQWERSGGNGWSGDGRGKGWDRWEKQADTGWEVSSFWACDNRWSHDLISTLFKNKSHISKLTVFWQHWGFYIIRMKGLAMGVGLKWGDTISLSGTKHIFLLLIKEICLIAKEFGKMPTWWGHQSLNSKHWRWDVLRIVFSKDPTPNLRDNKTLWSGQHQSLPHPKTHRRTQLKLIQTQQGGCFEHTANEVCCSLGMRQNTKFSKYFPQWSEVVGPLLPYMARPTPRMCSIPVVFLHKQQHARHAGHLTAIKNQQAISRL